MARLREPDLDRLPPGALRTIVTALHEAHRAAGSPSFRRIEDAIMADDDYDDIVSRQTISQMFNGVFIPRWSKVDCVVRQLAKLSTPRRDPDDQAARFLTLWNALGAGSSEPQTAGESQGQVEPPGKSARASTARTAVRPAGRYADGTQLLPEGGLAQVDDAVAVLRSAEYNRGWADGLQLIGERPAWDLLADLARDDFDVERWTTRHRLARVETAGLPPRGKADPPEWWSIVGSYLGWLGDPLGEEDHGSSRSPGYLAGFGDALRAAWARAGGKLSGPPIPAAGDEAIAGRALQLLELQLAELAAAAAPSSMSHKPDEQAYQDRHRELEQLLDRLGVTTPYPWSSVATGVAALKSQFTGNGAYARRRTYLRQLLDPVAAELRAGPTH